ncbi:hypothetical protein MAR_023904, partial [Mya arenaria]
MNDKNRKHTMSEEQQSNGHLQNNDNTVNGHLDNSEKTAIQVDGNGATTYLAIDGDLKAGNGKLSQPYPYADGEKGVTSQPPKS